MPGSGAGRQRGHAPPPAERPGDAVERVPEHGVDAEVDREHPVAGGGHGVRVRAGCRSRVGPGAGVGDQRGRWVGIPASSRANVATLPLA